MSITEYNTIIFVFCHQKSGYNTVVLGPPRMSIAWNRFTADFVTHHYPNRSYGRNSFLENSYSHNTMCSGIQGNGKTTAISQIAERTSCRKPQTTRCAQNFGIVTNYRVLSVIAEQMILLLVLYDGQDYACARFARTLIARDGPLLHPVHLTWCTIKRCSKTIISRGINRRRVQYSVFY